MFYLGRRYDIAAKKATGDLIRYDSKDLVTHALCVGMTGSGKTGLGIAAIEEAAIDGVPVIVIDPKGDLTNLLLTFPDLQPDDFAPWINEDDARRAGKSVAEFAAEQAERWKNGLADGGQDGARIKRLRDAAEFVLYTPGSTAGVPVSVLTSLERPSAGDPELWRERLPTIVSSVLALVGIDAEPLKSREHILLSTIVLAAWQAGENLTFAALIEHVQRPPVTRIGVVDIDAFFPPHDRFALAMSLNALIASPGFAVWSEGEPLDVATLLRTQSGKPRVSIFSIAHLDDSQRMFFVALSPSTGEMSRPDESECEFRARLQQTSREGRDRGLDGLRRKFAPRPAVLEEKLRRANQAIARETEQATGQKLQTAISFGATLVGALLGRKTISATTLGRATTAARGIGRSVKESEDIERARQTAAAVEKQRQELEAEFATDAASLEAANDVATETLETITIKPKKTNIAVKLVALVWTK